MSQKIYVQVPLSQGREALIDLDDWSLVRGRKWHAIKSRVVGLFYAVTNSPRADGRRTMIQMHRVILSATSGDVVDHINSDGLDNRRDNIRICSSAENARNSRMPRNNTSGFKGVSFHRATGKFSASIGKENRQIHIGLFPTAEEAARAYDKAARELHGEFARLNFPEDK